VDGKNLVQQVENENELQPDVEEFPYAVRTLCRYIMELTTNGVMITDAIKFVQTNKKLMSKTEDEQSEESKESDGPDYDNVKDHLDGEIKQISPQGR
jgi:hypothetical protein